MSDGTTRWSRRRLLRAGAVAGALGLAGCTESKAAPGSTPDDDFEQGSVFRGVSFEAGEMIVELAENHDASRVALVSPSGETFASARVGLGATRVRLLLLDFWGDFDEYRHYEPGLNELVARTDDGEVRTSLDLTPELEVVDVDAYRDGQRKHEISELAVTIRNVGTGPTWPYRITFKGAPNPNAARMLEGHAGFPFDGLQKPEEVILAPDEERPYVSTSGPLLADRRELAGCEGTTFQFEVIVGAAVGPPLTGRVRVRTGGEQVSMFGGSYCTDPTVEVLDE